MKVKMNNETIEVLVNFVKNQEGWSLSELKDELISETKLTQTKTRHGRLVSVDLDECSVIWGGDLSDADILCGADDLVNAYTKKLLDGVCNMLESFKDQESFLYRKE